MSIPGKKLLSSNRGSIAIIFVVLIIMVVLASLVFYFVILGKFSKQNQLSSQPNSLQNQNRNQNPLIEQSEIDRVQNNYDALYSRLGIRPPEKKNYQFKFKLSDQLKKQSSLFVDTVDAASCNVSSLPDNLPFYVLKKHLSIDTAKGIAKEFGLTQEPTALKMSDGASIRYHFQKEDGSEFVEVAEPSGTILYHRAIATPTGSDIDREKAQNIAIEEIKKYSFAREPKSIELVDTGQDTTSGNFVVYFTKNYDGYRVIDQPSIINLGKDGSVCNVSPSSNMNLVKVVINKKGQLTDIIDETRKVDKSGTSKKLSPEDSFARFHSTLPIPPIVIGGDNNIDLGATVTVDELNVVWYDFGEAYGLERYVPMYLAKGSIGKSKVYAMFPAIDLDTGSVTDAPDQPANTTGGNSGTVPGSSAVGSHSVVQIQALTPPTPAPPPNVKTLPAPKAPKGPVGEACYGGLVDYTVSCSNGANVVCSRYTSASAGSDPLQACSKGCQGHDETVTVTAGQNPCIELLKRYNIDTTNAFDFPSSFGTGAFGSNPNPSSPGVSGPGQVACQIQGCPC